MADYWKSQDRKYCDFCKCWIADNKPSRDFHEKGRRHLENVKKRLKNITKESAKTQRENDKTDVTLKHMEAAAMAAYRRDVESNSQADLTSIAITNKLQSDNLTLSGQKIWHEAKSKEGHTYYWNTLTNESVWEPPKIGYLSLEEQREEQLQKTAVQLKEVEKHKKIEGVKLMHIQKAEEKEERARLAREKMKERRVVDDTPEPVYGPIIDPGKNDPYGKWQTVKEPKPLNLQLPEQPQYYVPTITFEPEPIKKEFKEKTVESLDDFAQSSSFKKRKIVSGAVRNTRKRLEDD